MLSELLIGFVCSVLIAALAYWRGSLTLSGAIGAVIIGTIIFFEGRLTWSVMLIAFFLTSSLWSHYKEKEKHPLAEKFQKGHRRDLGQVLANGGWGALIALAFALTPHRMLFMAYLGAIATVTADTWATELGVLSKSKPRLISTGHHVAVGTSGGVTGFGIFVALCGATVIGALALAAEYSDTVILHNVPFVTQSLWLVPIGAVSGLLGSLFDSLLGATVQTIYYCDVHHKETEARIHRCGRATRLIRGWRWLDNDWVNFLSSIFGSLIAMGVYRLLV